MDKTNLPPLPPSVDSVWAEWRGERELLPVRDTYYTADQMREYAARAVREAVPDGWVLSSERMPEIDVPVWGVLPGGQVLLTVRTEVDDGYAWCNTYNNVSFWQGKWTADDAEWDDDYPVFAWHPLPDMSAAPTQDQENGS